MNISAFLLAFFKPIINLELNWLASTLTQNKATYEANASAFVGTATQFVNNEVATLVKSNPTLSIVSSMLLPLVDAYLTSLGAQGVTDVEPLIDKLVAFIQKEEAFI